MAPGGGATVVGGHRETNLKVDDDGDKKKKRDTNQGLRNVTFVEAKADGYKHTGFSLKDAAPEKVADGKESRKRISLGGKE